MLFAFTAGEWSLIIGSIGAQIVTIVGVVLSYLKSRSNSQKIDVAADVAQATHTLVNSNMGGQLKISAIALRRLADMTADRKDSEAATTAEKLLAEHEMRQEKVDRGETSPIPFDKRPAT